MKVSLRRHGPRWARPLPSAKASSPFPGEGSASLDGVSAVPQLGHDLGLEFQRLVHRGECPRIELTFYARIRSGRAVGEPQGQVLGARGQLSVRPDLVDQAPVT